LFDWTVGESKVLPLLFLRKLLCDGGLLPRITNKPPQAPYLKSMYIRDLNHRQVIWPFHSLWHKWRTKPIYSQKSFSDNYFFFFINFQTNPLKNLHLHENDVSNTQSNHQGTLGTSNWAEYKGNIHLKLPPFKFISISLESRQVNSALVRPRLE
jgi:hypothetical protein